MQELLCHLVEKSTTGQFNLLLLMIREGLHTGKLRAGNYRVRPRSIPITFSCVQIPGIVHIFSNFIFFPGMFFTMFYMKTLQLDGIGDSTLFFTIKHICCDIKYLADQLFSHSTPSFTVLQEVLSAVIITKLLSCCQLPETCSKALWLIAPQIISAMVVRKTHTHPLKHKHTHIHTLL